MLLGSGKNLSITTLVDFRHKANLNSQILAMIIKHTNFVVLCIGDLSSRYEKANADSVSAFGGLCIKTVLFATANRSNSDFLGT